ncbi:MAG: carbon-nitrogen hydrolase family protein, partial [Vibrio sp.]
MSQVGLIQMTSSSNSAENLAWIESEIKALVATGVDWVVLPENALVFGSTKDYHQAAETLGQGPIQQAIAKLAKDYQIWIVVGSLPIQTQQGVTTTSLLYDDQGVLQAHYDKLHLFDVDVADSHKSYRESDSFVAGNQVVSHKTPFGHIGLSICYDLRFPALYQALTQQGAQILIVPAAFTYVTGKAHWQTLLKARAIETQCWVIG